jgi:hypothetical protein
LVRKATKQATLRRLFAIVHGIKSSQNSRLDWFKRQLFGRKPEKQLLDNPLQKSLFSTTNVVQPSREAAVEVKPNKRKPNTQRTGNEVNDASLRFDDRGITLSLANLPCDSGMHESNSWPIT